MTTIRHQTTLSLVVVFLSAAGAADSAAPLRHVFFQFGHGTEIFGVTSEGMVGDVAKNTLKQGQWWNIEKGTLTLGQGDLKPSTVGYVKAYRQQIKYAVFSGGATTTIVGIKAGCIFGFYTQANGGGILGFRSCPSGDFAYDYGYNATILTGMAGNGLLVGFHDNAHLQLSGLIVNPLGKEHDYLVPGADGTKILALAPGGRMVGTFLKNGRWHGFVANLDGSHLSIITAKINGKAALDTGVVAVQGKCTLGYFDMNHNAQSGFVRCAGKSDLPFTFNPTFLIRPRRLLEDGTVLGDFDGNGPTEGFLLPKFVKQ